MSEPVILFVVQILKSVVISLTFLFLGVTALAFIVNSANCSVSVLHPAIQVIKPISVLLGALLGVRGGKGALKGATVGGVSFLITWVILNALGKGSYGFPSALIDFIAFLSFGVLSGILAVSLKNG